MRDPEHRFAFPDGKWANWKGLFGFVERVEVGAHPLEVVFRCREPAPPFFLKQLAMFTCSIISPTALEEHGSKIRRNPVGTGPFRFVEWNNDVEIRLARNDDYWDGPPALATLSFRVSNNATVRSNRLIANNGADVIDNLDPATIPALEADPNVAVARRPQSSLCYLAMNNLAPPFDDPRVREAVGYAINKNRIIQLAYKGYAQAGHGARAAGLQRLRRGSRGSTLRPREGEGAPARGRVRGRVAPPRCSSTSSDACCSPSRS